MFVDNGRVLCRYEEVREDVKEVLRLWERIKSPILTLSVMLANLQIVRADTYGDSQRVLRGRRNEEI